MFSPCCADQTPKISTSKVSRGCAPSGGCRGGSFLPLSSGGSGCVPWLVVTSPQSLPPPPQGLSSADGSLPPLCRPPCLPAFLAGCPRPLLTAHSGQQSVSTKAPRLVPGAVLGPFLSPGPAPHAPASTAFFPSPGMLAAQADCRRSSPWPLGPASRPTPALCSQPGQGGLGCLWLITPGTAGCPDTSRERELPDLPLRLHNGEQTRMLGPRVPLHTPELAGWVPPEGMAWHPSPTDSVPLSGMGQSAWL